MQNAGFDKELLPELFALVETAFNYGFYRQDYSRHGGIPFLPPHVRQFMLAPGLDHTLNLAGVHELMDASVSADSP
jgi:hypothetical protein